MPTSTGHAFLLSAGPMLAQMADQAGRAAGRCPADPVLVARSLARGEEVRPLPRHGPAGRFRARLRAARGLAERRRAARRPDRARMPGRLVRRQPARHRQMAGRRQGASCRRKINVPALVMIPSGDRIVPPLSAAALADPQARPEERHAARPAARPYRHGGERPRARALLDAADRLAEARSCMNAAMTRKTIASTGACRRSGPCCSRLDRDAHLCRAWPTRPGAAIVIGFGRPLASRRSPAISWSPRCCRRSTGCIAAGRSAARSQPR